MSTPSPTATPSPTTWHSPSPTTPPVTTTAPPTTTHTSPAGTPTKSHVHPKPSITIGTAIHLSRPHHHQLAYTGANLDLGVLGVALVAVGVAARIAARTKRAH